MQTISVRRTITVMLIAGSMFSNCVEIAKPVVSSLPDAGGALITDAGMMSQKSWGPAIRINAGDANSDPGYAQIAIDASGNAIAVWQEETDGAARNAVWSSRYSAGGTWSPAATIDNTQGNAIRPQVAVTPGGLAYAAFAQSTANTGGIMNLTVISFDGAWGTARIIDSVDLTNAGDPRVAIGANGAATVAYAQSDGIMERVWANTSSSSWSMAAIVDAVGPSSSPEVALDASGRAAVTYVQNTGVFTRALWASRQMPGGWSPPISLTSNTGEILSSVSIKVDTDDSFLCVWSQFVAGHHTIQSARIVNDFATVTSVMSLSDGQRDAFSPQVSVGANGDVIAVWHETNAGVFFNHFKAATGSWSGAALLQPVGTPGAIAPKVGVDERGNAVAVWAQPTVTSSLNLIVWGAQFNASSGTWSAPVELSSTSISVTKSGSDQLPSLAVNANGEAALVWYEESEDHLTVGIWARVFR